MGEQLSVQWDVESSEYTPKSDLAGSRSRSVSGFMKMLQAISIVAAPAVLSIGVKKCSFPSLCVCLCVCV